MASAMIGNLAVSLTMNTAAFQRGATIAERRAGQMEGKFAAVTGSLKGIGAAIGSGVIIDGLSRMAMNAFEMASALSESAEQVGVSVEALQELRFAADQTGVGADKMDATIKRLNKSLGELQLGEKAAVSAFAAIGLSADELRGKSPDQALRLIADALNKLPDASQRVAIGQELMGRSFSDLLPLINGGSKALDDFAIASQKNGQISTADAARLDELADTWDKLKTRAGVATANLIANAAQIADKVGGALAAVGINVKTFDQSVYTAMSNASKYVANMVFDIGQAMGAKLRGIFDAAIAKVKAFRDAAFDMWDKVTRRSYVPDMVSDIAYEMGPRLDDVMVRPALEAVKTVSDAFMGLARSFKGGGFLDILGSLINVGLQLGGVGAFGKSIANRINAPSSSLGAAGGLGNSRNTNVQVTPSPYFDVVVDGRIVQATPSIIAGGGQAGVARVAYQQRRRVG